MAYFTRPGNGVVLEPLESPIIADSVSKAAPGTYETGVTAQDWFERRIRNRRLANRKVCVYVPSPRPRRLTLLQGPETWWASRGTEHSGNKAASYY